MINIIGRRKIFFIISGVVVVAGIISLAVFGLQLGVDFQSGTTMTLRFDREVTQGELLGVFNDLGYSGAVIQRTGDDDFLIRIQEINNDQRQALTAGLEEQLDTGLTVRDFYKVSPVIATETGRNAAIAVAVAAVFMLLYIVWAFRRMPKPLRWGACAIIALAHDIIVVLGVFSILGWALDVTVDALFITGMLTVVGYSVNNTVVVFDRIRENVSKAISKDFSVIVNSSILETLARCLNTSLTTLFVILAIFLFGGATVHFFILVLLIGVIVGTYTSICIAGSLLVVWDRGKALLR